MYIGGFINLCDILVDMLSQKSRLSSDVLKEYINKINKGFDESSVAEKVILGLLLLLPLTLITISINSVIKGYISALSLLFVTPMGMYLIMLTFDTFLFQDYDEYESISYDSPSPHDFDFSKEESAGLIVRDEKLKDVREKYPAVRNYVLCEIKDIYTYQNNKEKLHIVVDMPFGGSNEWKFDYPYNWDNSKFKKFAENLGYNKDNFYDIKGEYVFIKDEDETLSIMMDNPRDTIRNKIEDEEWSKDEINVDRFEDFLDTEFDNLASNDEIIVEDAPWDSFDDMR